MDNNQIAAEKKRILEVCDDESLRHITTLVCQKMGFEVVEAACGDEGIELYREHGPFDLVLTDYFYFDKVTEPPLSRADTLRDGVQFAKAIRDIKPSQKIAIHSGGCRLRLTRKLADVPILERGRTEFFSKLRALLNAL